MRSFYCHRSSFFLSTFFFSFHSFSALLNISFISSFLIMLFIFILLIALLQFFQLTLSFHHHSNLLSPKPSFSSPFKASSSSFEEVGRCPNAEKCSGEYLSKGSTKSQLLYNYFKTRFYIAFIKSIFKFTSVCSVYCIESDIHFHFSFFSFFRLIYLFFFLLISFLLLQLFYDLYIYVYFIR